MTNKEAKSLIARVRTKGQYEGDYYRSYSDSSTPFNQDVDILADALNKQVPKPVKITGGRYCGKYKAGKCQCGQSLNSKLHKYCPNCGQAINWEDSK